MADTAQEGTAPLSAAQEIRTFFHFWDRRFEDYGQLPLGKALFRDFIAALIVALVAIPLGIGFSIASGMRPEQGIVAGAFAGILGGLFGGSKYQVYGPTAAFITVIAGIVNQYDVPFLILASCIAGVIVMAMGLGRLGHLFRWIPNTVIVGFTIGIALTIMVGQLPDLLGGVHKTSPDFWEKIAILPDLFVSAHGHALLLGVLTFILIRQLYKISVYIPAPLIAIGLCTFLANEVWHGHEIPLVSTKYGHLSSEFIQLTLPSLGNHSVLDLVIPVTLIVFIAALESLLSARMADRIAGNPTPYQPNKELFGQGVVNVIVPLLNGFPCTGALARTATSIKVGAVSPLSSVIKGCLVLVLMTFFGTYLSSIPMAAIGGLLVFVAFNMVKPPEVKGVWAEGKLSVAVMAVTALMTVISDLFTAVGTGTALFYLGRLIFRDTTPTTAPLVKTEQEADVETVAEADPADTRPARPRRILFP